LGGLYFIVKLAEPRVERMQPVKNPVEHGLNAGLGRDGCFAGLDNIGHSKNYGRAPDSVVVSSNSIPHNSPKEKLFDSDAGLAQKRTASDTP
jgi:hypothetical protein